MPANTSQTGKVFRRNVVPFAPLALALAMNSVPPSQPTRAAEVANPGPTGDNVTAAVCDDNIADQQECHANYPTGCSAKGGYDPYLNYLKNLTPSPAAGVSALDQSGFDNLNSNTPGDLSRDNHADYADQLKSLGEGSQFVVTGYLYYYQHTGAESSNCDLTGPAPDYSNVDFHIGIGFDAGIAGKAVNNPKPGTAQMKEFQQNSIIVEMTPHYRAQFHPNDWTLDTLAPALGHRVRVTGQLLVDSEHNVRGQNCAITSNPQGSKCWRYSVWELHPVTDFQICNDDACTQSTPIGSATSAGGGNDSGSGDASASSAGAMGMRRSATATHSAKPQSGSTGRP